MGSSVGVFGRTPVWEFSMDLGSAEGVFDRTLPEAAPVTLLGPILDPPGCRKRSGNFSDPPSVHCGHPQAVRNSHEFSSGFLGWDTPEETSSGVAEEN